MTPKLTKRQREVLEMIAAGKFLRPANMEGTRVLKALWVAGLIDRTFTPACPYRLTEAGREVLEAGR